MVMLVGSITLSFSDQSIADCGNFLDVGRYQHVHWADNWSHHGIMMIESVDQCSKGTCFKGLWKIDSMGNTTNPVDGSWSDNQFTMRRHMGDETQVWNGNCKEEKESVQGTISDMRWEGHFSIYK
jgi:hypothetical protein